MKTRLRLALRHVPCWNFNKNRLRRAILSMPFINQASFLGGKNWSTTLKVTKKNIFPDFHTFILDNNSVMRSRLLSPTALF